MADLSTNRGGIYRIFNAPLIYRLNRFIVAPGGVRDLRRFVRGWVKELSPKGHALDVACGPDSWLAGCGVELVGVDLMEGYVRHFTARGGRGVVGAADALPFADGAFDAVWCVALLHHLPDATARRAIDEMRRVCRPNGAVVLVDGIYPDRVWHNPFGYAVRAADRGQFMRDEAGMLGLLPERSRWRSERFNVALTRLPFLACALRC